MSARSRLVVALALAAAASRLAAGPLPPLPTPEQRLALRAAERNQLPVLPPQRVLSGQQDVDIQSYDLTLSLDIPNSAISGSNAITFIAAPGTGSVSSLVLDLDDTMTVSSVAQDGVPVDMATVTHASSVLTIPLTPPLAEGASSSTVTVVYSGQPQQLSFGTCTFSSHGTPKVPLVFTLSEPDLGRGWWPSKDTPEDKATVTVHVEAPDNLVVASNGLETGTAPGQPGMTVTTWHESYPISTYLVAVSATDYVTWNDTYTSQDGATTMPVDYWALPEFQANAQTDWSITPAAIDFYARSFVEYPFLAEKYSMVMVNLWGGMEHQTATSIGHEVTPGDHTYDFVVVHELSHQWWGDAIGPHEWASIWLNEGFATYCEALWEEHLGGLPRYLAYMQALDPVQGGHADFAGTVHAPLDLFNNTVYDKGGWVLHMLRWVTSQPSVAPPPDTIFAILRAHANAHEYASASTNDFVATASSVAGQDLNWFFDEWVHQVGRPSYQVGWSAAPQPGGGFIVYVRVDQTQASPIYQMPVDVRLVMPSGTVDQVVQNDATQTDYTFATSEAPTSVAWDPDGWVLKTVASVSIDRDGDGWPDWIDGCPDVANPDQADLDGDGIQDACETTLDTDGDTTPDVSDCARSDPGAWMPPATDTLLHVDEIPGGARLSFVEPDPLGQRDYTEDVTKGSLADLRATRAFGSGACLGSAAPGATLDDPTPPAPGGDFFLALPWNGCPTPAGDLCR